MGAINLHELTKHMELDVFFMASSIVCFFGGLEQANYGAANAFLDGFATYRTQMGLPAISVEFGAIRGVGFLERNKLASRITKLRGFYTVHIEEVLDMTDRLIGESFKHPVPRPVFANQNWISFILAKDSSRFSHLILEDANQSKQAMASQIPRDEMEILLKKQLADILCIPAEEILPEQPMIVYGVDSLMSVELVNWVHREFNIKTTQMDILGGLSVNDLLDLANSREKARVEQATAAEFACLKKNDVADFLLLCFPYISGDSTSFAIWPEHLTNCEVWALESRSTEFEPFLESIVQSIKKLSSSKPHQKILLYGHSLGGHLAYHVAMRLQLKEDIAVCAILVGASPAPLGAPALMTDLKDWKPNLVQKASNEELIKFQIKIGSLPPGTQVSENLGERLRKDLLLLKNYEAQMLKYSNYNIKLSAIYAFAGTDDPKCTPKDCEQWTLFCQHFKLQSTPGGPLFIDANPEPFLKTLSASLTEF